MARPASSRMRLMIATSRRRCSSRMLLQNFSFDARVSVNEGNRNEKVGARLPYYGRASSSPAISSWSINEKQKCGRGWPAFRIMVGPLPFQVLPGGVPTRREECLRVNRFPYYGVCLSLFFRCFWIGLPGLHRLEASCPEPEGVRAGRGEIGWHTSVMAIAYICIFHSAKSNPLSAVHSILAICFGFLECSQNSSSSYIRSDCAKTQSLPIAFMLTVIRPLAQLRNPLCNIERLF